MYCKYCGNKIEQDSKYCPFCGKELNQVVKEEPTNKEENKVIDPSITRKSIKMDAKDKNKGPLYLGTIILIVAMIATMVITTRLFGTKTITTDGFRYSLDFTTTSFLDTSLIVAIFMIVALYFTVGISKSCLDISRDKTTKVKNIFVYPLKKPKIFLKLLGINILIYLISVAVNYIPIIGPIIYLVLAIYLAPALGILPYVMMDNDNISTVEAIQKAISIIKGNRVAYYALICTFIGWYILSFFTLFLLIIWFVPYISVALSNFYLSITKEKEYNTAPSGISNVAILAITISSYIILLLIMVMVFLTYGFTTIMIDDIGDNNEDIRIQDNYETTLSGDTVNISGLNVYIPDGYEEVTLESYTKAYISNEEDIVIGLITTDIGYDATSSQYANMYKTSFSSSYDCNEITTRNFNRYDWEVLDCNRTNVNIRNYIAIQNSKLYLLTITYENDATIRTNQLYSSVEKELSFANTVA